jgi:hypothetical protein
VRASAIERLKDAQAAPFGEGAAAGATVIRDFLHHSDVPFEWIELRNPPRMPDGPANHRAARVVP